MNRPVDVTGLAEDDLLLDRLGRGDSEADGGEVAALLAEWRAALPEPGPADDHLVTAAVRAVTRPRRRFARGALAAAVAGLVVCGGLTVAAADAGPSSPLWPITRLVYEDLADSRTAADDASRAVAAAQVAIGDGRYEQAAHLLDHASDLLPEVREAEEADRLRTRIAQLRALLPGTAPDLPNGPADTPAPGAQGPGAPGPAVSPPATTTTGTVPVSTPQSEPGRGAEPELPVETPPVTPPLPGLSPTPEPGVPQVPLPR